MWRGVILDSAAELHLFFAFRYIWSYSSFGTTALTFESVQILYINIYFLLHNFNCMKFFILKLSCLSFKLHCFLVLNGVDRLLDIAVFASNWCNRILVCEFLCSKRWNVSLVCRQVIKWISYRFLWLFNWFLMQIYFIFQIASWIFHHHVLSMVINSFE